MRLLRLTVVGAIGALTASLATAEAQTPLAVETNPPLATRPVAPAPVLVPQPSGPPMVTQPPKPAEPIVVPPGPAPVAVPPPIKPEPVFTPSAPAIQPTSPAHTAPAKPETPPAEPPKAETPPASPPPAEPPKPSEPSAPPVVEAPAAPPPPSPPPPPAPAPAEPAPAAPAAPVTPPPPPAPSAEEATVAPRPVLFVTGVTTWEKSEDRMSAVFGDLAKAAKKLGVEPNGGPLVEYIESDSDDVGFRAMLPVAAPPKGKLPKGVKIGSSPAGRALRFHHDGPIDDLEEVYARIDDELAKRGLDTRAIVEEYDVDALASPEDRVVRDVWVFLK